MPDHAPSALTCDVLVIGSGAGGLSAAITAKKHGFDVVVVEKEEYFGGTTAFSGGVLWIPGNPHARHNGIKDSREAMVTYMKDQTGPFYDDAAITASSTTGRKWSSSSSARPKSSSCRRCTPTIIPTRRAAWTSAARSSPNPTTPAGSASRHRPPEPAADDDHLHRHDVQLVKRRPEALLQRDQIAGLRSLCRQATGQAFEGSGVYRRGVQVTSGNALAARLAKSAFDLGIPIHTHAEARELMTEDGRVTGALVRGRHEDMRITARRGVVLACGGYPHDVERITKTYPHLQRGGEHLSPTPTGNTGDGLSLAEQVGGQVDIRFHEAAAWMPVSRVPLSGGKFGVFPHLLDRYKPGIIGVLRNGRRFTNESNSYHDVGAAMIAACEGQQETAMWLICDQATIGKYGLGYAKPSPMPLGSLVRAGYLFKGKTLAELAKNAGIDGAGLEATVANTMSGPSVGRTPSSAAARPRSTAIWPIRRTSLTPASRRSARGHTTPSRSSWVIWAPSTASRPRCTGRC